ncbi:secreted RxLR effector protein 161-like [Nicotiana tabacum]|uniref:Secreted RxLR effector protein 161-like n=1 Tax=Nicotiana tabacum TaxID=4097 RepID=A0AC58SN71_TOBAC
MISQQKYIKKLLKRFDMETSKIIDTPITTSTRLDMDDLVPLVGLCAGFQSNPKESHLKAAKRILRYLKGMHDLVLYYPSGDNFDLIGYTDVDYAGYLVGRKITSGMAHFLGSCPISWGTRKQNLVALSTTEADTSALNIVKHLTQHKRTKHIDVRHHFLRGNVEKRHICMKFCSTEDEIADIFTKH